jgi:hypothetical protein
MMACAIVVMYGLVSYALSRGGISLRISAFGAIRFVMFSFFVEVLI